MTPLPNLFFSELLPAIEDVAEIKVTLHIFWLLANSKAAYVRASELAADPTLIQSLAVIEREPAKALTGALALAVERGTLLHFAPRDQDDDLYFLNTERGRRAYEKIEMTELPRETLTREPAAATQRPNIFTLYEQNIGLLTPMIAEELKEAELQYSAEWLADAFKLAVENNKRSWSYARKILERWQVEGRAEKSKKKTWYDDYGKFVKR